MFTAPLFIKAKYWKEFKHPFGEQINKMVHYTMEFQQENEMKY